MISLLCIVINKIYAIYAHGVNSASMSNMYLYPLIGGSFIIGILWVFGLNTERIKHFRLYYNLYNSGIALAVVGNMVAGIMYIAGTASPYTIIYYVFSIAFVIAAIVGVLSFFLRKAGS